MSNAIGWQPHAKKSTHRLGPPFGTVSKWVAQMRKPIEASMGKESIYHLCSGRPHNHKSDALAEARAFIASLARQESCKTGR